MAAGIDARAVLPVLCNLHRRILCCYLIIISQRMSQSRWETLLPVTICTGRLNMLVAGEELPMVKSSPTVYGDLVDSAKLSIFGSKKSE